MHLKGKTCGMTDFALYTEPNQGFATHPGTSTISGGIIVGTSISCISPLVSILARACAKRTMKPRI